MKKLAVLSFILMTFFVNAQEKQVLLANKTFIAEVGTVCEDTPDDNPCAGETIYLV